MRILVIGGAGYIGSHAVRLFLARGHEVWVYDNLSEGHRAAVPADRLIVGDLKEAERLDHAILMNRIDAVVHFAALAYVGESVTMPAKYYQNNVANTLTLLEVLRRNQVKQIVFSSSCATYGIPAVTPMTEETPQNPINPYGRTKLIIEYALRDYAAAYGWGTACLRYFNASGASSDGSIGEDHKPETHLIPLAIQAAMGQRPPLEIFGTDYPTPDGTCIRDYIHVTDLADAHVRALDWLETTSGAHAFNLGTGNGASVRQVLDAIERVAGKPVPHSIGPRRAGDPAALVSDPAKAVRDLGWKPRMSDLDTIVATAWAWHRR